MPPAPWLLALMRNSGLSVTRKSPFTNYSGDSTGNPPTLPLDLALHPWLYEDRPILDPVLDADFAPVSQIAHGEGSRGSEDAASHMSAMQAQNHTHREHGLVGYIC